MSEREDWNWTADALAFLSGYLANWPWHANARKHWYIMNTKRRIAELELGRERGDFVSVKIDEERSRLETLERGDILERDVWFCQIFFRLERESFQHPMIDVLRSMREQMLSDTRRACLADPKNYMSHFNTEWLFSSQGWRVAELLADWVRNNEPIFANFGIYIYYHPYEGYKIGKAENVIRRMVKHECSAPSLELLHVIETSDLDWCERFLHQRYARQRIYSNHEYFNLHYFDLHWLLSVKVLDPPRTEAQQHSLLDLL